MNRSKAHKKKKREEAEVRQKAFRQTEAGKKKYNPISNKKKQA